jgi:hypothetical protein
MSAWTDAVSGSFLASHRFADGGPWSYVANGLVESGSKSPVANTPELITEVFSTFGDDLRNVATEEGVPIELLVAAIALVAENVGTASAAHYVRYLDGFTGDNETPGLAYVGCTGLRFDRVRALLGGTTIADYVSQSQTAIRTAARHILSTIVDTRFQPPMVASVYNKDGSIVYDPTSRWKMANGEQIDRFLGWFNAAIAAIVMNASLAVSTPSFAGVLATIGPAVQLPPSTTSQSQKYFKPESQAAIDAGMMTICESNPSLSTIWSLDDVTTTQITNLALGVGAGQGLPLGQPAFAYPDRNRTMRLMNPDEVQKLYRAMRDYITAIILYDTGHSPSLPGQPVFMT